MGAENKPTTNVFEEGQEPQQEESTFEMPAVETDSNPTTLDKLVEEVSDEETSNTETKNEEN